VSSTSFDQSYIKSNGYTWKDAACLSVAGSNHCFFY